MSVKHRQSQTPNTPAPEPTKPKEISSLAELQALIDKPLRVELTIDGQLVNIPVRRLTPAEDAQLEAILAAVVPPFVKGKTMEEDRPDFNDKAYIKARQQAEIEARSLGLYQAVSLFKSEQPNLKNTPEIVAFIQSKLNTHLLNILWQAVRNSGIEVAALVNFTSASPLNQS